MRARGKIVFDAFEMPVFHKRTYSVIPGTVLAGNSLTEEVKRALYHNNNPNSSTRSATDGENSDTQSTEGLPPTKRLDRVAFPEEEDKQLLMELMKGRRQDADQSMLGQHHVEVKRVTSNRYRDSDSESDSCPSSPRLSSRNESMFARTDSPRSSIRSSGVSSDGRITIVTDVGGLSDMEVASVDTMAYGSTSGWEQEQERYAANARSQNYDGSASPDSRTRTRDRHGVSGSCDPEAGRSYDACSAPVFDDGYRNSVPRDYRNNASGQNAVRSGGYRENAHRDGSSRSGSYQDSPQSTPGERRPKDDGYRDSPNRLRPYRDSPPGASPQRGSPLPAQSSQKFSPGPSPSNRKPANAAHAKDFSRRNLSTSSTDSETIPHSKLRKQRTEGSRTPSPDDRHGARENWSTARSGGKSELNLSLFVCFCVRTILSAQRCVDSCH